MNWQDKTIFIGDNLLLICGMNSESVDLIYLDLPFNSNRNYAVPIGSRAAGATFKDAWMLSDVNEAEHSELAEWSPALAHGKPMLAYLIMMSLRLFEMYRMLKETGSIYLHCDLTASRLVSLLPCVGM